MNVRAAIGIAGLVLLGACSAPNARWLRSVEEAQRAADAARVEGDLEAAREHLLPVADGEGVQDSNGSGVRALRQDAHYQIARLALELDDGAGALRHADAGIALGGGDLYEANLWIVRGQANEHLGRDDVAGSDYHRALLLNDAMLGAMLDDAP
ncbi:MAG: hypothetical protein AAF411_04255 [Myxococcota bacterium]